MKDFISICLQIYKEMITFVHDNNKNNQMKRFFIMCAMFLTVATAFAAERTVTLNDVTSGLFSARYLFGMRALPDGETYSRISDDGKKIIAYFYKNNQQAKVLFDVDNTVGEKINSFDDYILSPDGTKMLIQTKTRSIYRRSTIATYYIYSIADRRMKPLSDSGEAQNPVWSQDGNLVAFVRNNNIHLVKLLYDNAESQVTKDGEFNKIINGVPDWVYEEEFTTSSSMCFNADGTMICWIKYDESAVKQYSMQMFKGLAPAVSKNSLYPGDYTYKYPKAGEDNSKVSVWSYDIKSHQTRKVEVPLGDEDYIPRLLPTCDASKMLVITLNRHQDDMKIYAANPRSCVCQLLIENKTDKYLKEIALTDIKVTNRYIALPVDNTDNVTIALYNINGTKIRNISIPNTDIAEIYGVDDASGNVYFQAAAPSPKERQVFVSQANGKTLCLTPQSGTSSAQFSSNFNYFLKTWSNADTPYVFSLCNAKGNEIKVLEDNSELKQRLAPYALPKKEFFTFKTSEGVTLEGWMIRPAGFDASKKYPVIMHQYSGPGSQQVHDSWSIGSMGAGASFDYYLASKGFIMVCVDGRGTGFRGTAFEKAIYQQMGELESRDQVETALWLGQQSYVDKSRIGIWGWSFGGFNTLMSMSEGRQVFCAGVAIAPPTSWRFYDTIYTERFMRTPKENSKGYDINPIKRAKNLSGALLIVHGLADDNVHAQNTFEYTEELVQADKDFRELIYTNRNHGIRGGNTRKHLLRQVADWFCEKMK